MKLSRNREGDFSRPTLGSQTICSLLKLACAVLAFGWLPWQSQLPTSIAGARCGFSLAVLRVHGKNYTRYKDAYFEQPTLRFRQNVFQEIHCADVHSSLLSSARLRGRSSGISNPWPPISDITCEAGTVHLIPLKLIMITLFSARHNLDVACVP
jgi:hypothetical protein